MATVEELRAEFADSLAREKKLNEDLEEIRQQLKTLDVEITPSAPKNVNNSKATGKRPAEEDENQSCSKKDMKKPASNEQMQIITPVQDTSSQQKTDSSQIRNDMSDESSTGPAKDHEKSHEQNNLQSQKVFIPNHLMTRQGVIKNVPIYITGGEIMENLVARDPQMGNLQVLNIRRFVTRRKNKEGQMVEYPTKTVQFTFRGQYLPPRVSMYKIYLRVEAYCPQVRQCYRCFNFGHMKSNCKSTQELCVDCGEAAHNAENPCPRQNLDPQCKNCKLSHKATDRSCEVRKRQQEIRDIASTNNVSVPEAKKMFVGRRQFISNVIEFPTLKNRLGSNDPQSQVYPSRTPNLDQMDSYAKKASSTQKIKDNLRLTPMKQAHRSPTSNPTSQSYNVGVTTSPSLYHKKSEEPAPISKNKISQKHSYEKYLKLEEERKKLLIHPSGHSPNMNFSQINESWPPTASSNSIQSQIIAWEQLKSSGNHEWEEDDEQDDDDFSDGGEADAVRPSVAASTTVVTQSSKTTTTASTQSTTTTMTSGCCGPIATPGPTPHMPHAGVMAAGEAFRQMCQGTPYASWANAMVPPPSTHLATGDAFADSPISPDPRNPRLGHGHGGSSEVPAKKLASTELDGLADEVAGLDLKTNAKGTGTKTAEPSPKEQAPPPASDGQKAKGRGRRGGKKNATEATQSESAEAAAVAPNTPKPASTAAPKPPTPVPPTPTPSMAPWGSPLGIPTLSLLADARDAGNARDAAKSQAS
ncbi:hypothetical protein QAD02_023896 [Eretmocerus hayati]|uniref:Uncharacterized protein n=1 Tax=Eretmocerus hayati TaxID=131215 RepID=A0ACC2PX49_9HYME|nr:hypothetical protein QAD02_023896 [Eretmocerus hayati]